MSDNQFIDLNGEIALQFMPQILIILNISIIFTFLFDGFIYPLILLCFVSFSVTYQLWLVSFILFIVFYRWYSDTDEDYVHILIICTYIFCVVYSTSWVNLLVCLPYLCSLVFSDEQFWRYTSKSVTISVSFYFGLLVVFNTFLFLAGHWKVSIYVIMTIVLLIWYIGKLYLFRKVPDLAFVIIFLYISISEDIFYIPALACIVCLSMTIPDKRVSFITRQSIYLTRATHDPFLRFVEIMKIEGFTSLERAKFVNFIEKCKVSQSLTRFSTIGIQISRVDEATIISKMVKITQDKHDARVFRVYLFRLFVTLYMMIVSSFTWVETKFLQKRYQADRIFISMNAIPLYFVGVFLLLPIFFVFVALLNYSLFRCQIKTAKYSV